MSSTADPNARIIQLDSLPLAIVTISCAFFGLSFLAVSLRTYTRLQKGIFGLDDAFMVAGLVAYVPATGLTIYGFLCGLGRLDQDLNQWQWSKAMEYYIIWILVYVVALATVKSSVSLTIQRIVGMKQGLRNTVWVLLAITWCSFGITFIGTLLYCRPVRTIWTPALALSGEGSCAPVDTFIIIAHTATVSTIVTDLALVVVPAILLWNTQMSRQKRLQAFGLLSFASVASIITMVRIPYVNKFKEGANLPFWVAHILLCSNVETGIGCIASSVPSLRHIFRSNSENSSSGPSKRSGNTSNPFADSGGSRQRRVRESFLNPTDIGYSLSTVRGRADDNWQLLQDGNSDRVDPNADQKGIYAERTYAVDIEMSSSMKKKKHRSLNVKEAQ